MNLIIIILVVFLLCGSGGYYGFSRYNPEWGLGGGLGTILLVLLLLYLFGFLRRS